MGVCTLKGQDLMAQKVSFGSLLPHLSAGQADSEGKLEQIMLTLSQSLHQLAQRCGLYTKGHSAGRIHARFVYSKSSY